MDSLTLYREAIAQIIERWQKWPRAEARFVVEPIMDTKNDRYIVMTVGWDGLNRIYAPLFHIDIVDGKLWIQRDNTEEGVANDLVASGVPHDKIVLAFQPEEMREWGDFALN